MFEKKLFDCSIKYNKINQVNIVFSLEYKRLISFNFYFFRAYLLITLKN